MNKCKVLGRFTSINVRKVLWAAKEMGIAVEREDWGLPIRDPNTPEFLRLNPNAQVPVLVEGDFVLWESSAILRYFGDRSASDLWPEEAQARALVDQWMTWQATELNPTWRYAFLALARKDPAFADRNRVDQSIGAWTGKMRLLETALEGGGGYIANGKFSLADIVLGLSSHRWLMTPFTKPELPAVEAHYRRMQATDFGAAYLGASTP